MKTFFIVLILGFAWQVSNASRFEEMKICLVENGFTDEYPDLELLEAIGDPENADRLKGISNEKMAGAIACVLQQQYEDKNLNDALKSLVQRDDKVTEEERNKMYEKLNSCNINAAGNNTKLLSCLNIMAPPFDALIAAIRDIPDSVGVCYPKCQVTIGQMYQMEQNKNKVKGLLEIVGEQKLTCFMGCIVDEEMKKKPNNPSFLKSLTFIIDKSDKHDENQKREMLETLNKCNTQVADVEDKTYELIKCVNMFKSPFIDLY